MFFATPLIFTGLAVAVALRGGLLNIGAEGQLYVAAFATAWVGIKLAGLPAVVLVGWLKKQGYERVAVLSEVSPNGVPYRGYSKRDSAHTRSSTRSC